MVDAADGTIATVTSDGEVTIPESLREAVGIDAPGRVRFVETEHGEVVLRRVRRPSEVRGALADHDSDEESATELLRRQRDRDG